MNHGALALLAFCTAPVTGVPAEPGVPALLSRVAKVSGWLWVSVRFTLNQYDQRSTRLPTEALACQLRNDWFVW
jgi:hypothetical protein